MITLGSDDLLYICDKNRHLICFPYSVKNLHLMAFRLNINKCWYHRGKFKHYDIPRKRFDIIKKQCITISSKDILTIIKTYK